jgi:hypothetical protein
LLIFVLMRNSLIFLSSLLIFLFACGTKNDENNDKTEEQDYYQFQRIDLSSNDLDATIMIPDATAGIGASFKPQINHLPADYKWEISIGRNFNLQIEDFGDNAYSYPEVRKKILENKAFNVSIVKEENDQVLYKRILDNSYHVYAVKKVDGAYYELKSREEGDSKKIAEFIYRSVKSFKKK